MITLVREAVRIASEAAELPIIGLFGPKMWRRTLAGTSVQMWQQLLGGNVMMYVEPLPRCSSLLCPFYISPLSLSLSL